MKQNLPLPSHIIELRFTPQEKNQRPIEDTYKGKADDKDIASWYAKKWFSQKYGIPDVNQVHILAHLIKIF